MTEARSTSQKRKSQSRAQVLGLGLSPTLLRTREISKWDVRTQKRGLSPPSFHERVMGAVSQFPRVLENLKNKQKKLGKYLLGTMHEISLPQGSSQDPQRRKWEWSWEPRQMSTAGAREPPSELYLLQVAQHVGPAVKHTPAFRGVQVV